MYVQQAAIHATRIVDGEAFVITSARIHHLNPTATVIWSILEEPASEEDITTLMCEIYPDTAKVTITTDVKTVLTRLLRDKLVTEKF
jgi:hypothetical protein